MQTVKYVKSFSRGQVTIPKEIRDSLGVAEEFWMKMSVDEGKLIVEPVSEKDSQDDYLKKLLSMDTGWFDEAAEEDLKKVREEIEEHVQNNSL